MCNFVIYKIVTTNDLTYDRPDYYVLDHDTKQI